MIALITVRESRRGVATEYIRAVLGRPLLRRVVRPVAAFAVVARAGDEMYESVARRAGADEVIAFEVVSGEQVTTVL